LFKNGFLPEKTHIIGYARTKMTHEEYIQRISQYIKVRGAVYLSAENFQVQKKLIIKANIFRFPIMQQLRSN